MKKKVLLLSAAFAMIVGIAQAQYQPGMVVVEQQPAIIVVEQPFKPEKGSFTTEIQFTPFGTTPISQMGFRGRYFFNERVALRFNVNFGLHGENIFQAADLTGATQDAKTKESSIMYGLAPGVEFHFGKWERVSVYTGVELMYEAYGIKRRTEYADGQYQEWKDRDESGRRIGYNKVGLNLLLGTDVYIVKGLYMGAELQLGGDLTFLKEGVYKSNDVVEIVHDESSTDWHAGFRVIPQIRLGWRF